MEVVIPEELYESLTLIIKYQNTLLLKEIANEMNWKYTDLKKQFLKDSDMKELEKKYKKKTAKKKKKKVVEVHNIELTIEDTNEAIVLEEPEAELVSKTNGVAEPENVAEPKEVAEPDKVEKPKKKKKLKKIVNSKEIKCHKYIFDGEIFYVNVENDNAYDKNMEFVGRKVGNMINFNEDELKN